jgi:hypothetical protein
MTCPQQELFCFPESYLKDMPECSWPQTAVLLGALEAAMCLVTCAASSCCFNSLYPGVVLASDSTWHAPLADCLHAKTRIYTEAPAATKGMVLRWQLKPTGALPDMAEPFTKGKHVCALVSVHCKQQAQ